MKRLFSTATAIIAFAAPQLADAQTPIPAGNNPTTAGLYLAGALGTNFAGDVDFDSGVEVTAETETGLLAKLAVGYSTPYGDLNVRPEGEVAFRINPVDQFGVLDALDESDISSIAGMANVYLDYYILQNTALSVGAGLGYASVSVEIGAEVGGVNLIFFDQEDDSGFAYQLHLGGRYDLNNNFTINGGYTYFAVPDLTVPDGDDVDNDFDYASHAFQVGLAFRF